MQRGKQQPGNHAVGEWLVKLNDAIYESDDLLDDLSTDRGPVARNDDQGSSFPNQTSLSMVLIKMGHKIKAIRERLDF
jgi:hypothetical protein